ncbi:MAG: hypothetical protein HC769_05855 [Cyanobacteria bacterium CRU_2_1]|nr:hypothetical protein [Cyanobacteria bacterium RU_5_0]NJR58414.1 hypothetical protein [Cyanobacteria bacterium CRU_2_1]
MLDVEQLSLVEPAFLITIVVESVLKESIVVLLKKLKVKSYTVSAIQGEGRYTKRLNSASESTEISQELSIETNVEIKAIVSQELSNVILYALKEQQREFAIFAYRQKVEALVDEG